MRQSVATPRDHLPLTAGGKTGKKSGMPHQDLDHDAPPSRRAKIIFGILICIVVLATVSSMATSVILYLKSV